MSSQVYVIYGAREIKFTRFNHFISLRTANQTESCSHIDKNHVSDTGGMLSELQPPISKKRVLRNVKHIFCFSIIER